MGRYFDDELYHWKYKDKYKGPSGKWIYIYDDGSSSQTNSKPQTTTSQEYNMKTGQLTKVEDTRTTNTNHLLTRRTTVRTTDSNGDASESRYTEYGKAHVVRKNAERKVSEAFSSKNLSRGSKAVSNLFNRVKKKKKKGGLQVEYSEARLGR